MLDPWLGGYGERYPSCIPWNLGKILLDLISVTLLFPLFHRVYTTLLRQGYLEQYKVLQGELLVGLDGSQYFSSQQICCEQCSTKKHRDGSVTYSHSAVLPVLVAPGIEHVISLAPSFIQPQDGAKKQDSETAAAKRWINRHAPDFEGAKITLLGDDLYRTHLRSLRRGCKPL